MRASLCNVVLQMAPLSGAILAIFTENSMHYEIYSMRLFQVRSQISTFALRMHTPTTEIIPKTPPIALEPGSEVTTTKLRIILNFVIDVNGHNINNKNIKNN